MRQIDTSPTIIAAAMSGLLLVATATRGEEPVTPNQVVRSFEDTFDVHPGNEGHPANDIDKVCAIGEFVGTSAGSALSRSKLFVRSGVPVFARFSQTEGNPSGAGARELAIEFRLPDGSRQHMRMLSTPTFLAADPITFNEMIGAVKPDPNTGRPDEGRLRDLLVAHPDTFAQSNFLPAVAPPSSYANSAYFSIHTFRAIDALDRIHFVRWRFIPRDAAGTTTPSQSMGTAVSGKEEGFIERLARGPLQWDMIVYVGEPGDTTDNPSIAWPEARKHFRAGTLTITQAMRGSEPGCEKMSFDPLIMADGIASADDPVLLFRSPTYAIVFIGYLSQALGLPGAASVADR